MHPKSKKMAEDIADAIRDQCVKAVEGIPAITPEFRVAVYKRLIAELGVKLLDAPGVRRP